MDDKSFKKLVFKKTKLIPKGKVCTYSLIAKAIGKPRAARAVGNALNGNHDPAVPCYRVVRSDGRVGGFNKGTAAKISLLKKESVKIEDGLVDLGKYLYEFKNQKSKGKNEY